MYYCVTHNTFTDIVDNKHCFITSCPPPDLPRGWQLNLVTPSPEELEQMNQSALELEAQFTESGE